MERYVIVLMSAPSFIDYGNSPDPWTCVQHFVGSRETTSSNQQHLTNVKNVQAARAVPSQKQSSIRDASHWMSSEEFLDCGPSLFSGDAGTQEEEEEEEEGFVGINLAEQLHELADALPKYGTFVDVLWLFSKEDCNSLHIENNLEFYGALKRLIEWHGAVITIATEESVTNDNTLGDWVELLKARVLPLDCEILAESRRLQWRGAVKIYGPQHGKPTVLHGFSLVVEETEQPPIRINSTDCEIGKNLANANQIPEGKMLGTQLEFLREVSLSSVPSHLVSHHYYRLCLQSESELLTKSRRFLERLHDHGQLGYLVRLDYGSSWKDTADNNRNKARDREDNSGSKWRHLVIENLNNATVSPFENDLHLEGDQGSHHFLLLADSLNNSCRNFCQAYLMKPASQLNGRLMHQLLLADITGEYPFPGRDVAERKRVQELLETLPSFSRSSVLQLQRNVESVQLHVVRKWIEDKQEKGESIKISAVDLRRMLSLSRELYMEGLNNFQDFPRHQTLATCLEIQPLKPEWERDQYTQLERTKLAYCSSSDSKFDRHKSSDSLASFGAPAKGQVVMIDAAEFLKYFKTDGTASKEAISLVSAKKSGSGKLYKHNSDEVKTAPWPISNNYNSHGFYYNNDTREDVDKKCGKLRARLQNIETSSTCTLEQANSPAAMTVIRETDPKYEDPEGGENDGKGHEEPEVKERSSRSKRLRGHELDDEEKRAYASKRQRFLAKSRSSKDKDSKSKASAATSKQQAKTKMILSNIVRDTVEAHGVPRKDPLYNRCIHKLYELSKTFVRDLTSSRNLKQDMKMIAESHVKQVIDFERLRQQSKKS